MDFIKKNWGLLLCALLFLAAVVFLIVRTMGYQSAVQEVEKQIQNDQSWFKTVNKSGWKVTPDKQGRLENAAIAKANKEAAEGHYAELKANLARRFNFIPTLPANSVQAQEMLNRKLHELAEFVLVEHKINWIPGDTSGQSANRGGGGSAFAAAQPRGVGGRFTNLAHQSTPLAEKDFEPIFRQLMVYEKLIRHIAAADIKVVHELTFPRWLTTEDAGDYTITPILLTVEGETANIQKLVNNLTNDPTMLFFIRSMQLFAPSSTQEITEYMDIAVERRKALNEQQSSIFNGNQQSGDNNNRGSNPYGGRSDGSVTVSGGANGTNRTYTEDQLVAEEPKRQDYLVFRTPRVVRVSLNLDLLEYKPIETAEE